MDPLEQQEKFEQIHHVDNEMNALFEAHSITKKELQEFRPIVQKTYMKMH
jgi:hypothetical protein